MAEITDFFGKASADTDYAQATTVKTARTPSETVLAAFDLSKFSPDTPVYFVTYKKEIDPLTNEVTIVNQTSWKGIVNPDINTLTNLTLAPGYVDIGNEVGDYIECIPTSYWGNSLIDGISVSHNQDGTLNSSALAQVYPVGSIYINATNNTNPATLFGFGTWAAFGAGRVPVGYDSGDSDFNAAEKTGGHKAMQQHTHTQSSHSHSIGGSSVNFVTSIPTASGQWSSGAAPGGSYRLGTLGNTNAEAPAIQNAGTGNSGNLQPYITVYMWKRTA